MIFLPTGARSVPEAPVIFNVASSKFVSCAGPLTVSVRLKAPFTEHQWQPGSCMATVTGVRAAACFRAAEAWPAATTRRQAARRDRIESERFMAVAPLTVRGLVITAHRVLTGRRRHPAPAADVGRKLRSSAQ